MGTVVSKPWWRKLPKRFVRILNAKGREIADPLIPDSLGWECRVCKLRGYHDEPRPPACPACSTATVECVSPGSSEEQLGDNVDRM
jgi:hypothetical protein